VSEADYLADLPIVLSVSRLAQPLDEVPGAVTIIDRDMIRMSGARHVTELLRFVPGFQVSDSFDALAPLASYHGGLSSFPNQMQVLIDGRSVYASYVMGTVAPGLQSIDLDDIERIEVLRGSNSAAYGARAFLGVVNIITRDPAATRGVSLGKRSGENGIDDVFARIGWGDGKASYRISAGQRRDSALAGSPGRDRVSNVNLRGDFHPTPQDELELRAGATEQVQLAGQLGFPENPPRDRKADLAFVQADWRRTFAADNDLQVSFSHGEERYADRFAIAYSGTCGFGNITACFNGTVVDSGGRASNDNIGFQHTLRAGDSTRLVWGGEWRSEKFRTVQLLGSPTTYTTDFRRLFGNVELRPLQSVVLNVGGLWESSSISGANFAPRVMANWHFLPEHTLRIGASRAYRPPSIYEDRVDATYVGSAFSVPWPPQAPSTLIAVQPVVSKLVSAGNLRSESLTASEIGYFGDFRNLALTMDLRAFYESFGNYIGHHNVITVPITSPPIGLNDTVKQYANEGGFPIRGIEAQVSWRPWPTTRIVFNHASIRIDSSDAGIATAAPREMDGLTLFQRLPGDVELSLMQQQASSLPWTTANNPEQRGPAWRRLDVRLGKSFQVGGSKVELAAVVQNIGPAYYDYPVSFTYQPTTGTTTISSVQQFQRRAFLTLSVDL
jgi:iron complex outermembrane receptor protein